MFSKMTTKQKLTLDEAIATAFSELAGVPSGTAESTAILEQIKDLHELRFPKKERKAIDPNTVILGAVNLIGIGAIIRHEEFNVLASKAVGLLKKV